jgi:hypothetical protein
MMADTSTCDAALGLRLEFEARNLPFGSSAAPSQSAAQVASFATRVSIIMFTYHSSFNDVNDLSARTMMYA